jgi:chitinase
MLRSLIASIGVAVLLTGVTAPAGAQSLPRVVPGSGTVVEGSSGSQVIQIPVTLTEPSDATVTAQWTTIFGPNVRPPAPAEPGVDFEAASGTVTFEPGTTETTVEVTVFGDDVAEPDEYIVVAFGNPVNAAMGGFWGLGFGIIDTDDGAPLIVPAPPGSPGTVTEGDTGPQTLQIPVTLTYPSTAPVTVDWRTFLIDLLDPPTATEGSDYSATSGTVTFEPGSTAATVSVTVLGDTTDEPDEWVLVEFRNPRNGVLGPIPLGPIGFGLIVDDD